MCWICLQNSNDGTFPSYKKIYQDSHPQVHCTKDRGSDCQCLSCSYKTSVKSVEFSLLLYLCDALEKVPINKLPALLAIASNGNRYRTPYFHGVIDRFDGITDEKELRAKAKQLRK